MKNIIGILLLVFLISACGSPEEDFRKAEQLESISAYEKFINKYPDSQFVESAEAQIHTLAFKNAKEKNTISAYEKFINKYPDSQFVESAEAQIHTLAFKNAKEKNTISAYEIFLKEYSDSKYAMAAFENIQELRIENGESIDARYFFKKIIIAAEICDEMLSWKYNSVSKRKEFENIIEYEQRVSVHKELVKSKIIQVQNKMEKLPKEYKVKGFNVEVGKYDIDKKEFKTLRINLPSEPKAVFTSFSGYHRTMFNIVRHWWGTLKTSVNGNIMKIYISGGYFDDFGTTWSPGYLKVYDFPVGVEKAKKWREGKQMPEVVITFELKGPDSFDIGVPVIFPESINIF